MNKKYLLFTIILVSFFLAGVAWLLYLADTKTIYISTKDCRPKDGVVLANIDGKPYHYDPVYLFKVMGYAMPENPNTEEKRTALYMELAYFEAISEGETASYAQLQREVKIRKAAISNWDDTLTQLQDDITTSKADGSSSPQSITEEEQQLAEMKSYVQRFRTLWQECTEGSGITASQYWKENAAYLKKGILINHYTAKRTQMYIDELTKEDKEYSEDGARQYLLANFDQLIEKFHVEIIDKDLK